MFSDRYILAGANMNFWDKRFSSLEWQSDLWISRADFWVRSIKERASQYGQLQRRCKMCNLFSSIATRFVITETWITCFTKLRDLAQAECIAIPCFVLVDSMDFIQFSPPPSLSKMCCRIQRPSRNYFHAALSYATYTNRTDASCPRAFNPCCLQLDAACN